MHSGAWNRGGHLGEAGAMAAVALKSWRRRFCWFGWQCHSPGFWPDLPFGQCDPLAFDWKYRKDTECANAGPVVPK